MPDIHDLDEAFRAFEQDIAHVTRAPGAGVAVRSARHRRRTTIGAVAVGLALVGGAVMIGTGTSGRDDTVRPAGRLPAPAAFDGAHLTSATHGWTPAWGPMTDVVRHKIAMSYGGYCFPSLHSGHGGIRGLANPHGDGALAVMSDYGRAVEAQAAWRSVERQVERCPEAHPVTSFTVSSGIEGRTYRVDPSGAETAPEYLWIATTGSQVGALKIFGQSNALPAGSNGPVAGFLLAALQDPGSYHDPGTSPGHQHRFTSRAGRIDPAKTLGQVWPEPLEPALTGWTTPWLPKLDPVAGLSLPQCAGAFDGDTPGPAMTVSVGTNGYEWVKWFREDAPAQLAVDALQQALASCPTPYDVHTVTLTSGRPVVVAAGSDEVLWFTRVASHVLVLQIPAGSTPPPDEVSLEVGAVLEHVLRQPATTTMSPDEHTKTPEWMQQEIAAAPTFGP